MVEVLSKGKLQGTLQAVIESDTERYIVFDNMVSTEFTIGFKRKSLFAMYSPYTHHFTVFKLDPKGKEDAIPFIIECLILVIEKGYRKIEIGSDKKDRWKMFKNIFNEFIEDIQIDKDGHEFCTFDIPEKSVNKVLTMFRRMIEKYG